MKANCPNCRRSYTYLADEEPEACICGYCWTKERVCEEWRETGRCYEGRQVCGYCGCDLGKSCTESTSHGACKPCAIVAFDLTEEEWEDDV